MLCCTICERPATDVEPIARQLVPLHVERNADALLQRCVARNKCPTCEQVPALLLQHLAHNCGTVLDMCSDCIDPDLTTMCPGCGHKTGPDNVTLVGNVSLAQQFMQQRTRRATDRYGEVATVAEANAAISAAERRDLGGSVRRTSFARRSELSSSLDSLPPLVPLSSLPSMETNFVDSAAALDSSVYAFLGLVALVFTTYEAGRGAGTGAGAGDARAQTQGRAKDARRRRRRKRRRRRRRRRRRKKLWQLLL